jgi:hypothetical protein
MDHLVEKNDGILFKELRDMILSIFSETSLEYQMLKNANMSAQLLAN